MKKTILTDMNSLAIKDVHFKTKKIRDVCIGVRVFHPNAKDLRVLYADSNYCFTDLREECRSNLRRPLIKYECIHRYRRGTTPG